MIFAVHTWGKLVEVAIEQHLILEEAEALRSGPRRIEDAPFPSDIWFWVCRLLRKFPTNNERIPTRLEIV